MYFLYLYPTVNDIKNPSFDLTIDVKRGKANSYLSLFNSLNNNVL